MKFYARFSRSTCLGFIFPYERNHLRRSLLCAAQDRSGRLREDGFERNNVSSREAGRAHHPPALAAAFNAFNLLHDVKMHLLQQADTEHPGQEGWVMATPSGMAKAVNRFGFTRANVQQNNPDQLA
jgi:hypothetical protein